MIHPQSNLLDNWSFTVVSVFADGGSTGDCGV